MEDTLCKASTKEGKPCKAYLIESSEYCFFHDPELVEIRRMANSEAGKARHNKYEIPYLFAIHGHLLNSKSEKCILCHDADARYCSRGLSKDKLYEFMSDHPYLYVLAEFDNYALNEGFWWFGVRDTRDGETTFDLSFYSNEPVDVKLPEREKDRFEDLSFKQFLK